MKRWFIILLLMESTLIIGQTDLAYQIPDTDILSLADASPAPALRLNKDATFGLLLFRKAYKSIEELSNPELKLAGLRIDANIMGPSRITSFYDVKILDVEKQQEFEVIGLPAKAVLSNFTWSNNQQKIAFTHTTTVGIELWVLDLTTKACKRLTGPILNLVLNGDIEWFYDDQNILVSTRALSDKKLIDTKSTIPSGPIITENEGQKAQNRTYQDLLKNAQDEHNFEYLTTSELTKVGLDGRIDKFLPADMYMGASFSPDGNFILCYTLQKPFSYLVTLDRFPVSVDIYNANGNLIKNIAEVPLTEELPKGFMATRTGKRSISWRSDKPSTLFWVEALDGGDPAIEVDYRDAIFSSDGPLFTKVKEISKSPLRYAGILWGDDNNAMMFGRWWNTRTSQIWHINPSNPKVQPRLFNERNSQDNYSDPGSFVTIKNQYGWNILEIINDKVTMLGDGFTKEGKYPFIDQYTLKDFTKKRLYQNFDTTKLENLISALDTKKGKYLVRLESKNDFPNVYIRDIQKGKLNPVTEHKNPFDVVTKGHKEVITYTRPDGVELSATLYLPVGYDKNKKEKLPMIMWAYPTEFKDKSSASQITSNANEFTYLHYGSPLYWLTKGYVVLDDASFPIVGEGDNEPNDSFIPQLVANAKAAIDAVDSLGYIDRTRVAVGGHSYGAFMTANLLTHSDLFAAGIARSGAYNRTLTPFGFQSEERNYWEASEVYDQMSPFQNADKMKYPLLLIHGEDDNNSGTFPMQSERYFNALKGLGATTRLVVLPKESHGYAARESILHMIWEQDQWLERFVKNKNQFTNKP